MVFPAGDAARSTYLLWHRFKFQTNDSIHDAIAVPSGVGTKLITAYGFMIQLICANVWAAAVLTGVYLSVRKEPIQLAEPIPEDHALRVSADAWESRNE